MHHTPPTTAAEAFHRMAGFLLSPYGVGVTLCLVATVVLLVAILADEARRHVAPQRPARRRPRR